MKLVNVELDFVVMEFRDHQPIFYDRYLEAEMKEYGISVPSVLSKEYDEKATIYLGDDKFERAFKEIYVPDAMDDRVFQWED